MSNDGFLATTYISFLFAVTLLWIPAVDDTLVERYAAPVAVCIRYNMIFGRRVNVLECFTPKARYFRPQMPEA